MRARNFIIERSSGIIDLIKVMDQGLNESSNSLSGKNEEWFRNIFKNIDLPISVLDNNNTILCFNSEMKSLFPTVRIGDRVFSWKFENEEEKSDLLQSYNRFIISDKIVFNRDICFTTSKGRLFFRINCKKYSGEINDPEAVILMLENLTEYIRINNDLQQAKLNAEEADRLKTAFLANMSHEIRTPMHAIIGFTELLLNSNYTQQERNEYLELIRRSSNDLFNIIEDLIDIAKMESNQLKIKYKDCQPYKILSGLYPVFQESFRRNGIQNDVKLILNVNLNDKALHFFSDGERLKQVVSNLMNNAIKFTERGFIEYGFKCIDNNQLLFHVRDSGSGIPEKLREKIFNRFYQVEIHQQKNIGGAGLGLSICRSIVELLNGKLWLESEENKGSCFYFQIPMLEIPANWEMNLSPSGSETSKKPDWNNKRILVAEDDPINFVYIKEVLTGCGARVLHAKNGIEVIDMAETENKIDLILMDIKMPEIDGLEASRYISKVKPEIPIVALTAFAMEGDKHKCLKAGCTDYISKPIENDQLYEIIEKYIHIDRIKSFRNIAKFK